MPHSQLAQCRWPSYSYSESSRVSRSRDFFYIGFGRTYCGHNQRCLNAIKEFGAVRARWSYAWAAQYIAVIDTLFNKIWQLLHPQLHTPKKLMMVMMKSWRTKTLLMKNRFTIPATNQTVHYNQLMKLKDCFMKLDSQWNYYKYSTQNS